MSLISKLKKLGLNSNEAQVYLSCLELGESNLSSITERAGMPKTTVYETLRQLHARGFISIFLKKKKRIFVVSNPNIFQEIIHEQSLVAKDILPTLNALYHTINQATNIRLLEGESGLRVITNEILEEAQELLSIGSAEQIFSFPPEFFENFLKKRKAKIIPVRVIYTDSNEAQKRKKTDLQDLKVSKIVSVSDRLESLLLIWGKTICLVTLKKKYHIVVIQDSDMVQIVKMMFELIWKFI